jgi:release factor glutamine methyltransferase
LPETTLAAGAAGQAGVFGIERHADSGPQPGHGTVRVALAWATAELRAADCETPHLDAELLLGEALGVDRAALVIDAAQVIDDGAAARFEALVARRRVHEPVAYILGRRDFRYLTLAVDQRVLIPRPETELLVEAALELPTGARVIDVGTGSGAVALALKHERPDLEVWGSDVSPDALEVAGANARRLGLDVGFVAANLLDGAPGRADAVLANLPYVAAGAALPPDVERFEPAQALFGGHDGLELVRALVASLGATPFVALEIGIGQADAVVQLLSAAGYGRVERRRDLAGIERVLVGSRAADSPSASV